MCPPPLMVIGSINVFSEFFFALSLLYPHRMEAVEYSSRNLNYDFQLRKSKEISKKFEKNSLERLAGARLLNYTIFENSNWDFNIKCGLLQYRFPTLLLLRRCNFFKGYFQLHPKATSYDLDAKFMPCMSLFRRLLHLQKCSLIIPDEDPVLFFELLLLLDVPVDVTNCYRRVKCLLFVHDA